jgi:uncharacterized protein YodC (DUF2158 family)
MSENFKVGDVVRLKSGGPNMTVESVGDIYGDQRVWCVWFEKGKREDAHFPPATLELAP